MSVQLERIQIGVINVVNNIKYKEIPSTPTWKWQKFKLLNYIILYFLNKIEYKF